MENSNPALTLHTPPLLKESALPQSMAKMVAVAVAMLLGTTMLFLIGFSSNAFLHGAAHDVRHASGFPCH